MSDIARGRADIWIDGHRREVEVVAMRDYDRLKAENDKLRKALQFIVDLDDGDKPGLWHFEKEFNAARAALEKKP